MQWDVVGSSVNVQVGGTKIKAANLSSVQNTKCLSNVKAIQENISNLNKGPSVSAQGHLCIQNKKMLPPSA